MSVLVFVFFFSVLFGSYTSCPLPPNLQYSGAPPIPSKAWSSVLEGIHLRLKSQYTDLNIPCLSSGIVYKRDLIWTGNFGLCNGTLHPASPDVLFRIASNTKIFTDLMLYLIKERGQVDLDSPVISIEPRFKPQNPFGDGDSEGPTLNQLACHMGGVSDDSPCISGGDACSKDWVYKHISNMSLLLPPGLRPQYSNFGFGVLGRVLENVVTSTYENFVLGDILRPLGMASSGFNISDPKALAKMALGNGYSHTFYDEGYNAPCGQMYSSVNDLSKFIAMMLEPSKGDVLSKRTISKLLTPQYLFNDGTTSIALPWEMRRLKSFWVHGKDGNVDGFASNIALIPSLRIGMVVLTNKGDLFPPSLLTDEAMIDLWEFLSEGIPKYSPIPPLPPAPEQYAGQFLRPKSLKGVEIRFEDDQLKTNICFGESQPCWGRLHKRGNLSFIWERNTAKGDCLDGAVFDSVDGTSIIFTNSSLNFLTMPGSSEFGTLFIRQ